jgi:hypothetical protein
VDNGGEETPSQYPDDNNIKIQIDKKDVKSLVKTKIRETKIEV